MPWTGRVTRPWAYSPGSAYIILYPVTTGANYHCTVADPVVIGAVLPGVRIDGWRLLVVAGGYGDGNCQHQYDWNDDYTEVDW